jgi:glycosyltransferase involved in cell wall biosynthesis
MSDLIEIAIPTYNDALTLCDTLSSLERQTLKPSKVTLIDDASTDETIELARQYRDRLPLSIVRNKARLGLVGNWNRCVELASLEYLWILHSDDWLHERALEVVHYSASTQRPGMIASGAAFFSSPQDSAAVEWSKTLSPYTVEIVSGEKAFLASLQLICSSVIVRRGLYLMHGSFSDRFPYSPDEELWPRLAAHASLLEINGMRFTAVRTSGDHEMQSTWKRPDFFDRWNTLHDELARMALELDPSGSLGLANAVQNKRSSVEKMVRQWLASKSDERGLLRQRYLQPFVRWLQGLRK